MIFNNERITLFFIYKWISITKLLNVRVHKALINTLIFTFLQWDLFLQLNFYKKPPLLSFFLSFKILTLQEPPFHWVKYKFWTKAGHALGRIPVWGEAQVFRSLKRPVNDASIRSSYFILPLQRPLNQLFLAQLFAGPVLKLSLIVPTVIILKCLKNSVRLHQLCVHTPNTPNV